MMHSTEKNDSPSNDIELTAEQIDVLCEAYRLLLSWAKETPYQTLAKHPESVVVDVQEIGVEESTNLSPICGQEPQLR